MQVETNTACGSNSDAKCIFEDCGGGPQFMTVYPNPASSEVYIERDKTKQTVETTDALIRIELYNNLGILIKTEKYSARIKKPKLLVSGLRKEIYYLRIVSKEIDEVHELLIE